MNISKDYLDGFRDGHDQGCAAGYVDARKEIEGALSHMERVDSCRNCPFCDLCLNAFTNKAELCGMQQEVQE